MAFIVDTKVFGFGPVLHRPHEDVAAVGMDEEEDHRGDGCAHLPIMADQATPPQADRDQPGEDHEAEPEGVEQEHALVATRQLKGNRAR